MRLLFQRAVAYLIFAGASAFAPAITHGYAASSSVLEASKANNHLSDSIKAVGIAATIFAFNLATPSNVEAQQFFGGSSTQLAETIKTMEFSLPSSYDAIADVKKKSVDELSQDYDVLTGTVVKTAPKAPTERIALSPMLSDEEKKAIEAQKKADKEAFEAQKKALEAEKKAEQELVAKEKAAAKALADKEKAVAKKAQIEAKARDQAAKEEAAKEKQFNNVEFVDTGLPSYGDSGKMRGKSAFSL